MLKACLKLNVQKTKIMASSRITSWQIDGQTMETVTEFIFLGSKITVDGDCSYEIKQHLLTERKAHKNWLIRKVLRLGNIEGRGDGDNRMRWLDGITDSMDMSLSELGVGDGQGRPSVLRFMESQRVRHNWATELNSWDVSPSSTPRGLCHPEQIL